jgi:hypothetical protein
MMCAGLGGDADDDVRQEHGQAVAEVTAHYQALLDSLARQYSAMVCLSTRLLR